MLTKPCYIITRGEHNLPQHVYGSGAAKLRVAGDLTEVTIFEDEIAAEAALVRTGRSSGYAVRQANLTMEIFI